MVNEAQDESVIDGMREEIIFLEDLEDKKIGEPSFDKPHLAGKFAVLGRPMLIPSGDIRFSKAGTYRMEDIQFKVPFKIEGTNEEYFENYGGLNRFVQPDGSKSAPSINIEGNNAAANLFKAWIKYKRKDPLEVSIKEFLMDLEGKKVRLKEQITTYQGTVGFKNVVESFL